MNRNHILAIILSCAEITFSQIWSFSSVADPRSGFVDFTKALTEIRDLTVNPEPKMKSSDFILVNGDYDPADKNYQIFQEVFKNSSNKIKFLPVMGNHDLDSYSYIKKKIISDDKAFVFYDSSSLSYYMDWKNSRFIIVDQYNGTGFNSGCINQAGINWVEQKISSSNAEHIFISFHEPAFPKYRHINNSFDECKMERDEFWNMILKYKDRVRAVLVGHTHFYYDIKIKNANGDVTDPNKFPIEEGGIYQIDAGAAGNSEDGKVTIVEFLINGKDVIARVVQSEKGAGIFKELKTIRIK